MTTDFTLKLTLADFQLFVVIVVVKDKFTLMLHCKK